MFCFKHLFYPLSWKEWYNEWKLSSAWFTKFYKVYSKKCIVIKVLRLDLTGFFFSSIEESSTQVKEEVSHWLCGCSPSRTPILTRQSPKWEKSPRFLPACLYTCSAFSFCLVLTALKHCFLWSVFFFLFCEFLALRISFLRLSYLKIICLLLSIMCNMTNLHVFPCCLQLWLLSFLVH